MKVREGATQYRLGLPGGLNKPFSIELAFLQALATNLGAQTLRSGKLHFHEPASPCHNLALIGK